MMNFSRLTMPRPTQHELTRLQSRHREVIRLAHTGLPRKQIAEQVGLSYAHVGQILKSELAQEQLDTLEHMADTEACDIKARIEALQGPALDYLQQVIEGDIDAASPSLRVKTAQDLLDRGGNGKVTKVEGTMSGAYLIRIGVENIKKRGLEQGVILEGQFDEQHQLPQSL